MPRAIRLSGLALMLSACAAALLSARPAPAALQAQSATEALRAKFEHESDPIHKAHLLLHLGDAEFRDIQNAAADHPQEALAILQQYREQAMACQKALEAVGRDPEKHPNGFKELQISLRESLRRLDAVIGDLPEDDQKPFRDLREDLDQMDRILIHELFPRQPDAEPPPAQQPDKQPDKPKPQDKPKS